MVASGRLSEGDAGGQLTTVAAPVRIYRASRSGAPNHAYRANPSRVVFVDFLPSFLDSKKESSRITARVSSGEVSR